MNNESVAASEPGPVIGAMLDDGGAELAELVFAFGPSATNDAELAELLFAI